MENKSPVPGPRARAKEQRRNHIIATAIPLFCSRGIENTSMEQISTAAEIGSATIYRYFPTKADLLKAAILYSWTEKSTQFLPLLQKEAYRYATGYSQLEEILSFFLTLYEQAPDFLRFLQTFDRYLQSNSYSFQDLAEYESMLSDLKNYAVNALNKGLHDGSLSFSESTDEIYFSIFHAMLSTTQKLALEGELLSMDSLVSGKRELEILKRLILKGLSP